MSIKDLPFRNFKIALIDKDLTALIVDPALVLVVHPEDLATAWETIQEEFSIAIGGDSMPGIIDSYWTVESLHSKVERLKEWLILFLENPLPDYIELFRSEDIDYPTDDLKHYVQCVRNEIATLELRMKEKAKKIETNEGEQVVPTHEHYADLMAEIRKMEGWPVPETITTLDFCTYYKRLVKHFERLKREYGNRTAR